MIEFGRMVIWLLFRIKCVIFERLWIWGGIVVSLLLFIINFCRCLSFEILDNILDILLLEIFRNVNFFRRYILWVSVDSLLWDKFSFCKLYKLEIFFGIFVNLLLLRYRYVMFFMFKMVWGYFFSWCFCRLIVIFFFMICFVIF